MTQDLGGIYYEVDLETKGLMDSVKRAKGSLDSLGGSANGLSSGLDKVGRSASSTASSFSGLSRVAASLMAILSVQQVAQYADAWTTLNNKLSNAIRPNQQLAEVTEAVFNITQQTRTSLEATATLYSRLERATRSYGTSASELTKLTKIINQGFVVSGATAQEAQSAVIQLSQGLASGALRGQEFNSVNEQGNRLIVALADSMGVTVGKMRELAAQGKLTTDVVVKGLLSQGDAIGKEFANTTTTISQALEVAGNNITKFFGENSTVKSGVAIFNSAIISISENIDVLGVALTGVAAIMGSRYVGALTMATQAKLASVGATIKQQAAEYKSAQAAVASAQAEIRNAQAIIASEQAKARQLATQSAINRQYGLAVSYQSEYAAIQRNIVAADNAAAAAKVRLSAATEQASIANRAFAVSSTLAKNALALVGGPAGAAMLAATAIYYFYQKAQQAKQESIDFADKLDGVISKMKEMNQTQIGSEIAKAQQSIIDQKDAISDLRDEMSALEQKKTFIEQAASIRGATAVAEDYQQVQRDIAIQAGKVDAAETKLSQTVSKTDILRAQMNGNFAQGIDLLKRDGEQAGVAAGLMNQFGNAINFASRAKEKFNSTSLEIPRSDKADAYNKDLADENTLLAITDKRLRAVTKARMEAGEKGGNQNQINAAGQLAAAQYDLQQAETARNKETKTGISEGKKAETQAKRNSEVLEDYRQKAALASDSISGLSREQALLQASQKLSNPSPQQVALVEKYAAAAWDKAAALKAQNSVPELKENADYTAQKSQLEMLKGAKDAQGNLLISQQQYNATSEQLEQQHQINLAKIRAERAVTPQQAAAGTVDPVQALANENAQKLALIQQFEQQKIITQQQSISLMNAANTQYEQARIDAAWQIWENQSRANQMLGDAIDSLQGGATNAITGLLNGTQSLAESFANIGTTILNSVVSGLVEMGLQYVKNMIMGQAAATAALASTTAQATAAAAAWAPAAISASIATMGAASTAGTTAYSTALVASKGLAIAGARKNGGPVSAGSMYQVGEGGRPEIYQASTGKQYMIPGDNGKVISNKDMIGGSSGSVVQQEIHFNIQTTNGIDDATMNKMAAMMKTISLNQMKDQSTRPGGMLQPRK